MAYRGPQWPAISRQVMARDNYTCQSCGAQPGQREISYIHGRTGKLVRYRKWMLHVHHIDGFSRYAPELYDQFNDPSRLITLCLSSHNKVHPRSREGG